MIIDALLIAMFVYYQSAWLAIVAAVLVIMRHWPWLADEIARMLELEQYAGLTAYAARLALPAWRDMSSATDADAKNPGASIHVPVPSTVGSLDTNATIRDQFLVTMADAKDERGAYLFSANAIHAAIGGHRATVLAQIKDRRAATLPAQFRQDDGSTAPASYPMTKSS